MEKNPSLASQDVIDESSILKLKIATAIAIIRMKPSDMTAQQYTQQLSQQMKNNNESWKKKAQRMEMELLQTRQELVKTKLGCNDKESGKDSEEIAHQSSASVFPTPPCSADNSHIQEVR
uniref:Meiosis-specific protein MEI4-like n=1 Tax=Saccoglossus kowalevskii TaxID=10224 RepID=A0ABM0M7I4_SACKO|nr:PREDICTED: meiosis-specific protein MEI4-like [Saccoglossus kowalevskii]